MSLSDPSEMFGACGHRNQGLLRPDQKEKRVQMFLSEAVRVVSERAVRISYDRNGCEDSSGGFRSR